MSTQITSFYWTEGDGITPVCHVNVRGPALTVPQANEFSRLIKSVIIEYQKTLAPEVKVATKTVKLPTGETLHKKVS